jgi:hypothetical protein
MLRTISTTGQTETDADGHVPARNWLVVALWTGTVVTVVTAGLLMWSAQGEAVFMDMLASAFAMCF